MWSRRQPQHDPTANVTALVVAEAKRQDDLRTLNATHLHELLTISQAHAQDLRLAESARIDAILAAHADTAARAAEQVATTAETLRAATALALAPVTAAIEDLRRTQFTQQGEKSAHTETKADTRDSHASSQWALGFALSALVAVVSVAALVARVAAG